MSKLFILKNKRNYSADLNAVVNAISFYLQKIDKPLFKIETEGITYADFFGNKMLIIRVIREGLPYKLFSKIKNITPFTEEDWAEY